MWKDGQVYREKRDIIMPLKHKHGIYSKLSAELMEEDKLAAVKINDKVTRILIKVDTMRLHDKDEKNDDSESSITQGDKLNEIKARRQSQTSTNTGSDYI